MNKLSGMLFIRSDNSINWHPSNALSPILATVDGIYIFFSEKHSENAYLSIDLTDEGISMLTNDLHLLKANFAIVETE